MNKRILVIFQVTLFLATLAGSVYVAFAPANSLLHWYDIDDAFYYYKVAQNILSGHGITFDQINLTNGFHPLWMVVCIGVFWLSKFNLLLPLRVLVVVSGLLNAATSLVIFRFLKRHLHLGAALVGALFWGLFPTIYKTVTIHGMESSLSIFFIVLLLSTASNYLASIDDKPLPLRRFSLLGILGGLAILARLDNVFVVGMIGIFVLLKIRKIPVLVIYDAIGLILAVCLAWIFRLGSTGIVLNALSFYTMLIVSVLGKLIALYFSACFFNPITLKHIKPVLRIVLAFAVELVVEYVTLFGLFKLNITTMFSNSIVMINSIIGFIVILIIHLAFSKSMQVDEHNPFSSFWLWSKKSWKPILLGGLTYALPIAVLVGSYVLLNKLTFGIFSPVSGQIKQWWGTMSNTVYSHPATLLSVFGLNTNGPWSLVTLPIYNTAEKISSLFHQSVPQTNYFILIALLVGLLLLLLNLKQGSLTRKYFLLLVPAILIGSLIHITYYTATGYTHTRIWYWIAELFTLVITGSLLLHGLFSWLDQIKIKVKISSLLVGLAAIFIALGFIRYLVKLVPYDVPIDQREAYLSEIKEVEFYTAPGSKIGMTGGGMVAYFIQDRTIVNLDGLISSPEYFDAMKAGTAAQFLDKIPLNYVYGRPYMLLESDPYDEIFMNKLVEIGVIRGYENFTLYQYKITQ